MLLDHREIGRQLDLFMFSELAPGCPIWLPAGNTVFTILQDKIRKLNTHYGYVEVRTPAIWKDDLYRISGHLDHYADNMFYVHGNDVDVVHVLKPMNCPGHMEIFRSKHWSVNQLPYRMADHGLLHRDEPSGSLGGMTRCRAFCQDDAHLFVTPQQIAAEIALIVVMVQRVYGKLGMSISAALSTRPPKFMGETSAWDAAEEALRSALVASHQEYAENPGDGAFYGPKIDFTVTDSLGRGWQTATVQLDFQLPQRFALKYADHDNIVKTPVVIHRAIYGSFERFIGILLEHYVGDLPVWLAPVQAVIMPITDKLNGHAVSLHDTLVKSLGLRVELDTSSNRLQHKIAVAQCQRVPYMLIVGNKEVADDTVSMRDRSGVTTTMSNNEFLALAESWNTFDF